jgi:predicted polyphosphate/ATP-dependent NAD kinase
MPYKSAIIQNVLFIRWDSPPTREEIEQIKASLPLAMHQVGGKYASVSSIAPNTRVPNADQRKAINEMIVQARSFCPCTYVIIEGSDLQHNLQRIIVNGLLIVTRIYDDFVSIHKNADEVAVDLTKRLSMDGANIIQQARARQVVL